MVCVLLNIRSSKLLHLKLKILTGLLSETYCLYICSTFSNFSFVAQQGRQPAEYTLSVPPSPSPRTPPNSFTHMHVYVYIVYNYI